MKIFDIELRMEYPYVMGLEIRYMDEDNDYQTGVVRSHTYNYITLESGDVINKARICGLISKEVEEWQENLQN